MVLVPVCDNKFVIDEELQREMHYNFLRMKKNWDFIFVCDGAEGTGKTTNAIELCYYMAWLMRTKKNMNRQFFFILRKL
jgi:DNA helicase IV